MGILLLVAVFVVGLVIGLWLGREITFNRIIEAASGGHKKAFRIMKAIRF
ncbi:MAG: hypothetical protein PHE88_11900 [Elusimicrobia bacterium]|nr:hypothetical protein [Elusimicrobiota bacterium]